MLRNYIKIGLRNLRKNKVSTFINLTGLSLSVTFCLLLFLHIRKEQSFDSFHEKKDRLYRLEMTNMWPRPDDKPRKHFFSFLTKNDETRNALVFPLVVKDDIKNTFPDIQRVVPIKTEGDKFVKIGNQMFKEEKVLFAGEQFFNSFSFRLLQGDKQTALNDKSKVVLSQSLAIKYFGDENPIGKTIEFAGEDSTLFMVSGVVQDMPDNSSIEYDMILPLSASSGYEENIKERFNHMSHPMILEFKEGVDAKQFEVKLNEWVKTYFTEPYFAEYGKYFKDFDASAMRWTLRPLAKCHYNVSSPWGHYTNAKNIYQLSCLVVIILLIASLNYILLAVSSGAARSQEVGVRKVMGATRRSVVMQFWVETQLLIVFAVVLGAVLVQFMLPVFNRMIGSTIGSEDLFLPQTAMAMLVLCVLLGLLAGYYPALFISRMKPVSILKSFQTFKVNPRFSKILVVTQYSVCIILMVAAFVINSQMQFISNKDLGFDKEQVVLVANQTYDREQTLRILDRMQNFASSEPSIAAFSSMTGGLDGGGNRNGFRLNGEQKWLRQMDVDYDYFKLLNIKLKEGRFFSRDFSSDTSRAIRPCVVNETFMALMGDSAKLGEYNPIIRATIIGVVKDYNFESVSKAIEPQQHMLLRGYARYFMFKIKPGNTQQTLARIENAWKQSAGMLPFEYSFLDQSLQQMYEAEKRWQNIVQASCFFAIVIACMGLFGLSAITIANRTKEIGIRKVLGASVPNLLASLTGRFAVMVLLAFVIAVPVSFWLMNNWLEDFAYRVHISWWMFAIVGVSALLIAMVTVGYLAVKAAMNNPIKSLRTE